MLHGKVSPQIAAGLLELRLLAIWVEAKRTEKYAVDSDLIIIGDSTCQTQSSRCTRR